MLLTLTIIFGLTTASVTILFWRERRARLVWKGNALTVSKAYQELRHVHGAIVRNVESKNVGAGKLYLAGVLICVAALILIRRRKSENE